MIGGGVEIMVRGNNGVGIGVGVIYSILFCF